MISQVRYFRCPVDDYDDEQKKFFLSPHLVWITNARKIVRVGDVVILSVLVGPETVNHILDALGNMDIFNPTTPEALSIEWYYIGDKESDITDLYPDLIGQEKVGIDDDGNPIMRDKIDRSVWCGF